MVIAVGLKLFSSVSLLDSFLLYLVPEGKQRIVPGESVFCSVLCSFNAARTGKVVQ